MLKDKKEEDNNYKNNMLKDKKKKKTKQKNKILLYQKKIKCSGTCFKNEFGWSFKNTT